MNRIKELAVEEMALEGARGISWKTLEEMVRLRQEASLLVRTIRPDFELIREELVSEGIISHVRGDVYELSDERLRFRALSISHLPVIYENGQSLRILEMVARGRQRGAWSFAICTALRVDAKQLFHLSNVLVEFGLILRFSSAPIPRHLKSHSSGTNASFFILTRYSSTNMMDPDIADVVDPSHSTENVCSLILALVREAGGLILSKVLRSAVVINGGFTHKQYRRGLARLSSNRRVELVWVPGDGEDDQEENDEDEDEEDEEKGDLKISSKNGLYAIKLVSVLSNDLHQAEEKEVDPSPHAVQISEEGGLVKEEQESSEEEIVQGGEEDLNNYMRLRNFLRSNFSYKESLVSIIEASGASGVTTREISLLTGVGPKEILKTMENVRANDLVETVWRNDGKKKFIVYKSKKNDLTINVDDIISSVAGSTPPPTTLSSGRGYVTDQTMRRSVLAAEILGSRGALSLIDLGRAIEALELSQGVGIPGAQIDRRTLKKICEISSIPLVEKGESSQTKIIIAYDPAQMTPAEACTRVDRPVGITPKAGSKIKTPPSAPPLLQKNSSLYQKISVSELTSKSRLAHLAVFGKSAESSPVVSFKVAELYGLVRGAEIFKAKQMHHFLLSKFALEPPFLASLSDIIAELPLLLYLQCIGCGVAHAFIDEFFSSKNFQDLPIRLLPQNVVQHLMKCVPAPANVTKTTQNASLAKVLAPLVKLNLIKIVKNGDKADLRYLIERDGVIITPSMDSSSEEVSARVAFMENGEIVYPAIEEYWSSLLRVCMHWRRSAGTGVVAKNYLSLPQVFRRQQWRCKVVVTLGQRRELEALLKRFLSEGESPSRPVVVDGSNEELVKVCARNNMDPITALKALRQLHALFQDGNNGDSSSLVFANVNQARFSCPHCGQLFFQLSSIQRHFQVAHSISAPSDISEFTREEYMHALERARPSSSAVGGQKKRRRRRNNKGVSAAVKQEEEVEDDHQRGVSSMDASEGALYMKAFSLARSLLNNGGETILVPSDPSLIDPSHLVWELTHRIMNDVEGSLFTAGAAELTRRACLKKSSSFPPPTTINNSVGVAVDNSNKTTTLASCLVLNKLLEADVAYVEIVCKNNGVELSQVTALMVNWHQNGVLAIERQHAKHHGGYTLSRSGRVCMFGKHSQVAKLCLIIENLIASSDFLSIEEEPPCSNQQDISSVVVACMLDRMQPESLFFDISENNILFAENVTIEQEDHDEEENDGFTGIKKHLDLSQQLAGTIARVELHQELPTTAVVGKIEKFLRELIRLSRSRKSHVWRPCPAEETQDEFPVANVVISLLPDDKNNPLLNDRLAKKIDCVYVPAAVGNNNNPLTTVPGFVSMVFEISKNFHALFAPLTDFPKIIAPWTDIDGDIREQLLADLLLNVLLLVYAFPGISVCAIKPHLVILTGQEIHWLVDIWIQLGLVEGEDDGLFLKSVTQWGGGESSS